MPKQRMIKKIIDSFKGLDRRTADLLDNPQYASEMINTDYREDRTLVKRKGSHILNQGAGGYGLFTYKQYNTSDGSTFDELLTADNHLHKLIKRTVTITNPSNPSDPQNIYVSLAVDPDTNTFKFFTDNSTNYDIGIGTETTPITLNQLKTNAEAFNELTVTIDSNLTGNEAAAFLEPFDSVKIADGASLSLDYHTLEQIPVGDTSFNSGAPFSQYYSDRERASLENINGSFLNNVMYFSNGFDEVMKYDGSKIYRAGLPNNLPAPTVEELTHISNPSATIGGHAVNLGIHPAEANKFHYYRYRFVYTDAQGNTISSEPSAYTKYTHTGNHRYLVKIDIPKLNLGSGFDISSGNLTVQIYRTKGVIDDSTVEGANFYLLNTLDPTLTVEANNSVVTSGAIPVAISSVNVDNGDDAGANDTFYAGALEDIDGNVLPVVNNYDNNFTNTDITFIDYIADSDTQSQFSLTDTLFLEQYTEGRHDPPPKGRYLSIHQGCLILAGRHDKGNEFNYSLPELNLVTGEIGSEYFPDNDRSLIIESPQGGKITAIKSLKDNLYVFHKDSVTYLSGDISITGAPLPRKDVLSKQGHIGCVSHACVEEYVGTMSFLSTDGIYNINNTQGYPEEFSKKIKPLFVNDKLSKERAQSFYYKANQLFLFYIPAEDTHNNIKHATEQSKIFCLDMLNGAWFTWEGLNMAGGITEFEEKVYFMTREYDSNSQSVVTRLSKLKDRGDYTDYTDQEKPIKFSLVTSWESLGDPLTFKKFLRVKTFIRDSAQNFESNKFDIDLYLRKDFTDYDLGPITIESGTLGGYGTGEWGLFSWGNRGQDGITSKLFGKAKSICFKYENKKVNENILISGIAYEVTAPYRKEVKE